MNSNPLSDKTVGGLIDAAELRSIHWRVWVLSAMGIFLDGFDLFTVAVAMPLIVQSLSPSPVMQGLIVASAVLGAIVGASVLGHLTDRWGRKSEKTSNVQRVSITISWDGTLNPAFPHAQPWNDWVSKMWQKAWKENRDLRILLSSDLHRVSIRPSSTQWAIMQ